MRIIQDIDRISENLYLIVEADGAVVPCVCNRNGHRNKFKNPQQYWERNPNRKALSLDEIGIHPDMCQVVRELWDTQYQLFTAKNGIENSNGQS